MPDLIAPGLRVLFCGINPGLYSGATGHHFARPGNRFWPALHAAGFSDRLLPPWEEHELLDRGLRHHQPRGADDRDGGRAHPRGAGRRPSPAGSSVRRYAPRWVAVLGVGAYRTAFGRPRPDVGVKRSPWPGARLWVLPNPSGLNAHYQLPDLVREFAALHAAAQASSVRRAREGRQR